MEDADGMMRRSPDELDAANLDFAIGKYQEAIAIKSDGPWTPKEKLDKATAQKAKLLQLSGPATEARKRGFCEKLGKASAARSYEQARYLACALANDDPAYQCGGDEALHLCQQMKELAQMSPRPPAYAPKAPDGHHHQLRVHRLPVHPHQSRKSANKKASSTRQKRRSMPMTSKKLAPHFSGSQGRRKQAPRII